MRLMTIFLSFALLGAYAKPGRSKPGHGRAVGHRKTSPSKKTGKKKSTAVIYYAKKTGKHTTDLFSIKGDGSDGKQLTTFEDWVECVGIDANAKGSHVVFTYREKMSNGLGIFDLKTGKATVVIKPSFKETTKGCALSPNGKVVAFVAGETFKNNLYVMSVTGSGKKALSKTDGSKSNPTWSPGGRTILFELRPPEKLEGGGATYNHPDVASIRSIGGKTLDLTEKEEGNYTDAEVSPDAKSIVYVGAAVKSKKNNVTMMGPPAIWTMQVSGKLKKKLTDDKGWDTEPTWSPDGTKIAFISTRSAGYANVFVINVDGTGMKQLTKQDYTKKMMPRWSKDGKKVYYVEEKDYKRKGAVVEVESGECRELIPDCQEFVVVEE